MCDGSMCDKWMCLQSDEPDFKELDQFRLKHMKRSMRMVIHTHGNDYNASSI
jgi:predicted AAA+ superfamily ATPase